MKEIPTTYDQKQEPEIYKRWEDSGFFNPDNLEGEPFTIIMPPSNANGQVHVGHALGFTLQDIMIRYQRMLGKKTLWLPGTDHAGFETQVVFEKKLDKEDRSRFQMTREEFYKEIWAFVQEHKKLTEEGIRRLGASVDWSRNIFTLDPRIIKVVYETFEQMYQDGLIYRGNRICNWCVKHQTGLADLETAHEERLDPLYYIKYGPITLATVRPETKFGDTAIAVHPQDARYKKYIGQKIEVDGLLGKFMIDVIADELVDKDFGTGAVKVTPAHDALDFEIWQKHKAEMHAPVQVIDKRGKLDLSYYKNNPKTAKYHGLKVQEARQVVVADLQAAGLIEKIDETYKHNVTLCYKCKNVLEPLIIPQWYVAMTKKFTNHESRITNQSLQELAIDAVKTGEVKNNPEAKEKVFMHWMENIRDWPISRQIWWGIAIPVWYCLKCTTAKINPVIKSRWFVVRHGETDWNKEELMLSHTDIALNEMGRQQARDLAKRLKNQNIELVISSDNLRTRETAEIIAKECGVEMVIDHGFREKHHGEAEGMTRDEVIKKYGNLHRYEHKMPGAESYEEVEKRVREAFQKHKENHGHKNVVIVSHASAIRTLVKHIKQLSNEEMFERPAVKNLEIFSTDVSDPCSKCGHNLYEQDPDTFDTWFSSGQWPYATLMAQDKRMGFHETIVPELLEKNKSRTYRLRDHGLQIGDSVNFENSGTQEIFGYGVLTGIKKLTVGEINLPDYVHSGKYETTKELIAAFKRMHPEKEVTKDTEAWIYDYEFHKGEKPNSDFETFYPTAVMETGWDILFFWVARMIMFGLYKTGKVPFRDVYLHGLVRDKDRQKMSKSKGNVVDPLAVIDTFGNDALRMALVVGNLPGNDLPLSEDKVRGYRNFANKIWNVARFVLTNCPSPLAGEGGRRPDEGLLPEDQAVLDEIAELAQSISAKMDKYDFAHASEDLYHYFWHTFADKTIEAAKARLSNPETKASTQRMLREALETLLKLLHPFTPFVTETIWQMEHKNLLMVEPWPDKKI